MLNVKTPGEVYDIIYDKFGDKFKKNSDSAMFESVNVTDAAGRVLRDDIVSNEDVPGFDRSTVDGYAVIASDTFGASEAIPAVLNVLGDVLMGDSADFSCNSGSCAGISTGGDLPDGCDAVVMIEHTEDYGDGLVGIMKPVAPGNNVIFRGDDVAVGTKILSAGTVLSVHDIGILSALGYIDVNVRSRPTVGIISTGDELIKPSRKPERGQVRDVNTPMLMALTASFGGASVDYGIVRDEEELLRCAVLKATCECDVVLVSGGSSAGLRDLTARIIDDEGELLLHGIAMKPGKPTILGVVNNKPVFGLPGHPVAAYFVTELFVRYLLCKLVGTECKRLSTWAELGEAISSNHGREEYIAVRIESDKGNSPASVRTESTGTGLLCDVAMPVRGKSGLIASLAGVAGYIAVPRDCEGLAKGEIVEVVYVV